MVDPNDPEMYYKLACEKKPMEEQLAYAVLSIAASMIKKQEDRDRLSRIEEKQKEVLATGKKMGIDTGRAM